MIKKSLFLFCGWGSYALAGTSCEQTISYIVPSCLELVINGTPTIQFMQPAAGENFAPVTAMTSYSLSCNQKDYCISCKLSRKLPDLLLQAQLVAPPGATSLGQVILTENNQPVVSGISRTKIQNGTITYTMMPSDTNVLPSEITGGIVTVIFTISS